MYPPNNNMIDPSRPFSDVPGSRNYDNDSEILGRILTPEAKTSYTIHTVWDETLQKNVKKSVNRPFQENNLTDLTSGILTGQKSEFAFAWHTILLINQLELIQEETGYNLQNLITFHRNNLMTNLSLSKSVDGALLKALTTKELKQTLEHRYTEGAPDGEHKKKFMGLF